MEYFVDLTTLRFAPVNWVSYKYHNVGLSTQHLKYDNTVIFW